MSAGAQISTFGDLPRTIAVFPLSRALLLPRGRLPLNIFEPRYRRMIEDTMEGSKLIGLVQPTMEGSETDAKARPKLYQVGCLGRIEHCKPTDDNRYEIILAGLCRYEIVEELPTVTPYRQVLATYGRFRHDLEPPDEENFPRARLVKGLKTYFELNGLATDWNQIEAAPADALVTALSMMAPVSSAEKQALLEAETLLQRTEVLIKLIDIANALGPDSGGTGGMKMQ